ncbi:MAG: glutamate synthase-related protein, partial [Verrucomicrobiota bacterium]
MLTGFLIVVLLITLIAVYDLCQRKHAILRNYPVIGHFRYLLEKIGPELRQYIVTDNDEERPFSRDQRRWIYASSKKENNYFGFGSDNEMETVSNYIVIKQSSFPINDPLPEDPDFDPAYPLACAKIIGGFRQRKMAFRPASVVNVGAMSYGSLGSAAVEALNKGCRLANCLHNTGEGGVAPHHQHGGDLIWQIGTGYYGCRDERGRFDLERL